jgi:hypothetical protein
MNTLYRWYHLIFNRSRCVFFKTNENIFSLGDVITVTEPRVTSKYKYIGKQWFLKVD